MKERMNSKMSKWQMDHEMQFPRVGRHSHWTICLPFKAQLAFCGKMEEESSRLLPTEVLWKSSIAAGRRLSMYTMRPLSLSLSPSLSCSRWTRTICWRRQCSMGHSGLARRQRQCCKGNQPRPKERRWRRLSCDQRESFRH
jgi:hypothetical protein